MSIPKCTHSWVVHLRLKGDLIRSLVAFILISKDAVTRLNSLLSPKKKTDTSLETGTVITDYRVQYNFNVFKHSFLSIGVFLRCNFFMCHCHCIVLFLLYSFTFVA